MTIKEFMEYNQNDPIHWEIDGEEFEDAYDVPDYLSERYVRNWKVDA